MPVIKKPHSVGGVVGDSTAVAFNRPLSEFIQDDLIERRQWILASLCRMQIILAFSPYAPLVPY